MPSGRILHSPRFSFGDSTPDNCSALLSIVRKSGQGRNRHLLGRIIMILSYLQDVKEGRTGFGNGVAEINAWISSAVPAVDWSIQKDCWSLGKTVRGRSEPIGRRHEPIGRRYEPIGRRGEPVGGQEDAVRSQGRTTGAVGHGFTWDKRLARLSWLSWLSWLGWLGGKSRLNGHRWDRRGVNWSGLNWRGLYRGRLHGPGSRFYDLSVSVQDEEHAPHRQKLQGKQVYTFHLLSFC